MNDAKKDKTVATTHDVDGVVRTQLVMLTSAAAFVGVTSLFAASVLFPNATASVTRTFSDALRSSSGNIGVSK